MITYCTHYGSRRSNYCKLMMISETTNDYWNHFSCSLLYKYNCIEKRRRIVENVFENAFEIMNDLIFN